MTHNQFKAVAVPNEAFLRGAVIVPEHLLIYISEQMERFDRNVCALESALEQAPEVLHAVCMNLAVNVALRDSLWGWLNWVIPAKSISRWN
jgi:hypothetical protein